MTPEGVEAVELCIEQTGEFSFLYVVRSLYSCIHKCRRIYVLKLARVLPGTVAINW